MARRRRRLKTDPLDYIRLPSFELDPEIKTGILVVFILAFGAICLLSLFNLAGPLGKYLNQALLLLFGWGRWLFALIILAWGFLLYNRDKEWARGASYLGLFILMISVSALLHLFINQADWTVTVRSGKGGGYLGYLMVMVFDKIMGFWASLIILIGLFLVSLMLIFNAKLEALVGSESWLAKLYAPINFILNKIFKRQPRAEVEAEEEELAEAEEPEEEVAEEIEGDWHRHQVKTIEAREQEAEGKGEWRATHIKIDLPLDLLSKREGKPTSGDIKNNSYIIQKTLENFAIPVEMGEINIGPTVTQYTLKPAEGIKLSRITTLSNDLALALAAHPIRIEAPIPGRSLVGVEVPNQTKAIVGLREVLESEIFRQRKSNLMIALGKDVSGRVWMADLSKMPHLLVAGATNSGKSVCLNSIIVSSLYQNNPDDLRFIMVDPKRVELPIYNGIPHLLVPVITDVGKTINALKWCLNEMDRRFERLAKTGKRDIQGYNFKKEAGGNGKMPHLIFIIDELADLIVAAAREVEAGIIRLAQMSRAVGIHLVMATQRPSVDIITGLIKANMPARIAFSVASGVDSRTILDSLGAEKLLGRGDMLFSTPEISKPKRLQGAFVSDNEIKRIVSYIQERSGEPQYLEEVVARQKIKGLAGFGLVEPELAEDEDLLDKAKELIIDTGKASASFLQRHLSIGYVRAARILDLLEREGVVGPVNGAKARQILITAEQYDRLINQGQDLGKPQASPTSEAEDEEVKEIEENMGENNEVDETTEEEEDQGKYFSR